MKLATLLYIKNSNGDFLLLKRAKDPNKGFLSPPGGKLLTDIAESPFQCAVREANEECGITSNVTDWKLKGIVTEKNYPNIGNIMIFLMEYKNTFNLKPQEFYEGSFSFIPEKDILKSNIPETDKLFIWKFVLNSDDNFFSISIDCNENPFRCIIETNLKQNDKDKR